MYFENTGLSEDIIANKDLISRKIKADLAYKSTIVFTKAIRKVINTIKVHIFAIVNTKETVYVVNLYNSKYKYRQLKIFLDTKNMKKIVSSNYDFCISNKQQDLNLLKKVSNFLFISKYTSFPKLYYKKDKTNLKLSGATSYVGYNNKSNTFINSQRLSIKKLLLVKYVRIGTNYVVVQFYSSFVFEYIYVVVYIPKTCRYYYAKLLYNHLEQIMQHVNKSETETFHVKKLGNYKCKRKFYEAIIIHNKNFFLKGIYIYLDKTGANILQLRNLKLILQNNYLDSLCICKNDIYNLEINIDKFIPYYYPNIILHLNEKSTQSLYLRMNNLKEKSCLNIKLNLYELSSLTQILEDNQITIGTLYVLAKYISSNFVEFWNQINMIEYFNNCNVSNRFEKFGLNHFSPILMPRYTELLIQNTYPIFIGKKVFSIKPKRICYIFLANKDSLQISVYNQTNRSTKIHYIRNEMLGNISNLVEYHLSMHLTKELSARIFNVLKNRFVTMIYNDN